MNVVDMLLKPDKNFLFQQKSKGLVEWATVPFPKEFLKKHSANGALLSSRNVRGIALPPETRILVKDAALFWPNFVQGFGTFLIKSASDQPSSLKVSWQSTERTGTERVINSHKEMKRFAVPPAPEGYNDLVIVAGPENIKPVFLGVHQLLDRGELFSRMKGNGVEIGPGPKPQVLPTWRRQVQYVEQATPDMWQILYGKETPTPVDKNLWKRYVKGTADDIPAKKNSLDFIFSSHVVEHLANPLGHLQYWASLLKPGGFVAAVIPDRDGCQDYSFPASSVGEIIAEWRSGNMQVTNEHFKRWGQVRMPKVSVEELKASGRSIHVHFYTPSSMANLLGQTASQLGFERFSITNQPNHKDFFLVLEK
jgi:hypothetical protein